MKKHGPGVASWDRVFLRYGSDRLTEHGQGGAFLTFDLLV